MTKYGQTMAEALQEVNEKLKPSDGAGAYVKDFKKSDAPQFKGKSDEKKQKMAVAAYLDAKGEEFDLDEGKMKQFHMMQTDGKSAEEIAKALKLDLKTVKALMKEEVEIDEMKMDDPKLVKTFDKLKRGDTVKLKTSSTISKGKDFVEYIVKSKNTVNKGRVEKVTLVTKGNEGAVKKFLYKRDGKVTFAIGDMGASIDDIKEDNIQEDGHTDVASAIRQCKTMIEDATQIASKLQGMNPEESLPSWWTNKLAVSSNSMNKLRDYFLVPTTEAVSPAQQAAIAISKKEKGEKPKEESKTKKVKDMEETPEKKTKFETYTGVPNPRTEGRKSNYATDDEDEEGANKNIIMQLYKAISLRGRFDVVFDDGKKEKVKEPIAQKAIAMHRTFKTSKDRLAFQNKIGKSYRDLLNTIR